MKAQFIVTIEGTWKEGDTRATASMAEKELRKVVKDGFEFLADRVTVKRHKPDSRPTPTDAGQREGGE